mgnify:CR=1 FL=1
MRCYRARKLIPKHLDGLLEEPLALKVRDHLASCDSCRRDEAQLAAAVRSLDLWPTVEPNLGYDAFLARLEQRSRAVQRPAPVFGAPGWAAASMAALGIAAGALLGSLEPGKVLDKPPTEQEVVAAMDLSAFDDVVEASFVHGVQAAGGAGAQEGSR